VFALLRGLDLDAAIGTHSPADAARIESAFRTGFVAAAVVAAIGAAIASRLPRIKL